MLNFRTLAKQTKQRKMKTDIPISLVDKDELINDPNAGFYTHYLLIANGFLLAHFTNPEDRNAYKRMLINEGLQGFPVNIMKTLFRYADPTKRTIRFNEKFVQPEQTGFVPNRREKVVIPFRTYKIEVCIYENIVFDPEIQPYTQFVVTANDFVIASFTHEIGAVGYIEYLKKKPFNTFPKDVLDVIHYYADPSKRLKNERKKV